MCRQSLSTILLTDCLFVEKKVQHLATFQYFLYFCKQIKRNRSMQKAIVRTLFYIVTVLLLVSCAERKEYRIGVSQCAEGRWREN